MGLNRVPWGENPTFEWDEANEQELWNHRVTCFEVEECFEHAYGLRLTIKPAVSLRNMVIDIESKAQHMAVEAYLSFSNIKVVISFAQSQRLMFLERSELEWLKKIKKRTMNL